MPKTTSRNKKNVAAPDKSKSRAAREQEALEGRGRDIYKYLISMVRQNDGLFISDLDFLYLSWLWLYADPKRELTVDQFMELTEPQIHERFDKLKSKNLLQKLDTFEKVIHLYAAEDGEVEVPYRYAV